jgi:two-component system chemotaxis response regulator CheY
VTGKALVVDDSALARRNVRRALEAAGLEVIDAEDGISALERYFLERPDVVLLDLVMKGMYGLEVMNKLREIDPGVRVIIISADIQQPSQQLAFAQGACAFVQKPVDDRELLDAVRAALGGNA